jgi:dolichol-phosphate mannosyltransferase
MDGDLQDSPETILRFIEKWKEGYDVVYSIRKKRKEFI